MVLSKKMKSLKHKLIAAGERRADRFWRRQFKKKRRHDDRTIAAIHREYARKEDQIRQEYAKKEDRLLAEISKLEKVKSEWQKQTETMRIRFTEFRAIVAENEETVNSALKILGRLHGYRDKAKSIMGLTYRDIEKASRGTLVQ